MKIVGKLKFYFSCKVDFKTYSEVKTYHINADTIEEAYRVLVGLAKNTVDCLVKTCADRVRRKDYSGLSCPAIGFTILSESIQGLDLQALEASGVLKTKHVF